MADEPITNVSTEDLTRQNEVSRSQQRIQELSAKVELTSKERDEFKTLLEKSTSEIATLKKENEFNSGLADVLSSHPAAKDHKDEIKQKVLAGYSVEDATFAVLGKAGKLGASAPVVAPQNPAGGSASTAMPQAGEKPATEMSQAERRAILEKELLMT